jgi:hypothetical protein
LAQPSESTVVLAPTKRQTLLLARGEAGAWSRDVDAIESHPRRERRAGRLLRDVEGGVFG